MSLADDIISVAPQRNISLDEQIKCVRRELALRERVYPGWVKSGRMNPERAAREIASMQAVLDTLTAFHDELIHILSLPPEFAPER